MSRYASPEAQGSALGFGQAAQAASRVLAPLASGVLYDRSKELGFGDYAAPYYLGGALSVISSIPLLLLLCDRRAAAAAEADDEEEKWEVAAVGKSVEMVKMPNDERV